MWRIRDTQSSKYEPGVKENAGYGDHEAVGDVGEVGDYLLS
jgi:hypothetical protein